MNGTKMVAKHGAAFALGVVNAYTSDHLFVAGLVDAEKNGLTDSKGVFFQVGQKIGHLDALISGTAEVTGEGAGEALSLGTATVPVGAALPFSISAIGNGAYHLFGDKIVYSTTPKNGETNATRDGRDAHSYDKYQPPGGNYKTRRPDTKLDDNTYPDAVDYENKVVRELKPNNSRKIREGTQQAKDYLKKLQEKYGGNWKFAVDTYDKNPNGTYSYHYGQAQTP